MLFSPYVLVSNQSEGVALIGADWQVEVAMFKRPLVGEPHGVAA
jgi:hypothetical protein